ncbi:MAG: restriction endonuclease subunit S [Rectinemataceae bacterium]
MSLKDSKAKATPRLRFPEFRGGDGWNTARMTDLYSCMRNNALSRDKLNYEHGTVKNIHYGGIHTKFSTLFDIGEERVPYINATEEIPDADSGDYCIEGDIILADASEDMTDVGKSIEIIRLNNERLLSDQHTILARPKDRTLTVGFGGHLFRSGQIRSQIQKEAQGTKVYAISATRLANIEIAYPSKKEEQQKIADCLGSLDELIIAQGKRVEALKSHKRGLMQELFPGEGETVPRLRFPEFREGAEWEEALLDELARRGSGHTPNRGNAEYYDGGIKWVSLADSQRLDNGYIAQTAKEISECGIEHSSAVLHAAGSVILCRDASIGKCAILMAPMAVSQHFLVWTCDTALLSNWFLYYYFQTMRPTFEQVASGSTIKTIGLPFFKQLQIAKPSLREQQRIASCISSLDTLIAAEAEKLEALKTHKKGLMQGLFPAMEEATK